MVVEGIISPRPGQESASDGAARTTATDVAIRGDCGREATPQMVLLSPDRESGLSHPRVPRLARRRLSRTAYALLENFRWLEVGSEGVTTYERLMRNADIHSRTTLARALQELQTLGIITTSKERAEGRVRGLRVRYLGLPAEIPEPARKIYIDRARRELEALSARMGHLERDIECLVRIGTNQDANDGEAV